MVNEPKKKKKRGPIWLAMPFIVGFALTSLVVGVAIWSLNSGEVCDPSGTCMSRWEALKASRPNEIGDALGGFAGALAFVWLIVTVWLQATELREQREEFEKMADAQQEQVKLLVTQGEIFKDEQRQRLEQYNSAVLDQKVRFIVDLVNFYGEVLFGKFEVSDCGLRESKEIIRITQTDPTRGRFSLFSSKYNEKSLEENIQCISADAFESLCSLKKIISADHEFTTKCKAKGRLEEIIEATREALDIESGLGDADLTRVRRMRLNRLLPYLVEIQMLPIWVEETEIE